MAIINACILASKTIKGGKNKVRISIAHNGQTRYIPTNIIIDSNKEFRNGAVVRRPDAAILNAKIRRILQRYQAILDELEYVNGLTCPELVCLLLNGPDNRHRTLTSIFEEYTENANIKPSSVRNYRYVWVNVEGFFGKKYLAESVTYSSILGFDNYLRRKGLKPSSVRNSVVMLKTVLRYAMKCGYVHYRVDPFWGYNVPQTEVRQSWLTVEQIKQIRDLEITSPGVRMRRDIFMLSYYLGGINIADLLRINFNKNSVDLCYERKKTETKSKVNKYVEFRIPEEALPIINRYKDASGYLKLSKTGPGLNPGNLFSYSMRKIEEATGIRHLIFYSARKSFAQHAFNLGISTSVIDYILGHKLNIVGTSLYSYIYVTPEHATKAIRQVLDNLK